MIEKLKRGPKPGPTGNKVSLTVRIPPEVKEFLETVNASQYMTAAILASAEYRKWKKLR
jgi:hypothetical protein